MKKYKNQKAITLVALVITIIILLILAGISISTLTNTGILDKTIEAKEKSERAKEQEQVDLSKIDDQIYDIQNAQNVVQVNDDYPGDITDNNTRDGSQDNPYSVNSVEDLVELSWEVRTGKNNYANKIIILEYDLDFFSVKSYIEPYRTDYGKYGYYDKLKSEICNSGFISIGTDGIEKSITDNDFEQYCFSGIFDGRGHYINNIKIDKILINDNAIIIGGLFNENNGTIKNLKLGNLNMNISVKSNRYSSFGGIVGRNFGNIENCIFDGNIKIDYLNFSGNVGGIVGSNNGNVKYSANYGVISSLLNSSDKVETRIGGISGANEKTGEISNSYNAGIINNRNTEKNVEQCKNFICGISGINLGSICNSYNVGKINNENTTSKIFIDGISYKSNIKEGVITNSFYLDKTIEKLDKKNVTITSNGEEKNSEEMKGVEILEKLNNKNNIWKKDKKNINNGYPILWFMN